MAIGQSIPVFIVEEHNQAFYVWWWAKQRGYYEGPATLFHFDAHPDMSIPHLDVSIYEALALPNDVERTRMMKDFVDTYLDIGSFIAPAICAGLVQNIYFIPPGNIIPTQRIIWQKKEKIIGSREGTGREFIGGTLNRTMIHSMIFWNVLPEDYEFIDTVTLRRDVESVLTDAVEYTYIETTPNYLPKDKAVIVDIDLDFFSSLNSPAMRQPVTINITKEYYHKYKDSLYHPLRYVGLRPVFQRENNHYLLVLEPFHFAVEDRINTEEVIRELADLCAHSIADTQNETKLLTISRSSKSGYTPSSQVEFIQETLLNALSAVLPGRLDIRRYDSLS